MILDQDNQIIVGSLAGSIQAINIPLELSEDDKARVAEWRILAENMLYRIALQLDGRFLDCSMVPWMLNVLRGNGRKVVYNGATLDSRQGVWHWFVIHDSGSKRRVAWCETNSGENALTIAPHESEFDFIFLLKELIC